MARKPFFSGNYGSALARVDTRPIVEAGRAQGQMFANMGSQIGGMIKEYGLNKEKRAELTGEIEAMLPQYMDSFTSTGNEVDDKKNFQRLEKFSKGDMSMADLKGLAGELAMKDKVEAKKFARETSEVNKKLLEQELNTKNELQELKKVQQGQREKAFEGLEREADEIGSMIQDPNSGVTLDNLNARSQFLYRNIDLIKNRQIDPMKAAFSSADEYKLELDKLTLEEKQNEIKGQELELTEKTAEAAKMPEFTDKASALASVQDRDPGVSAKIVPFKGGFNVSMEFKAKDFPTSVQPLEGFDDVYSHGGYLYKGITDKNGKTTMTKIAAEQIGQRSDLLGKAIDRLDDKTLGNYRVAKRDGELNDDGDYEFTYRDPVTREEEEMTIPFNPILEERLKYVDELTSKYQKTLDEEIDLDLTTR